MLRFINIHELHSKTPKTIHWVEKGGRCIVTRRGKPKALLLPLSEDEVEDIVLSSKPMSNKIRSAEKEARRKGWRTIAQVRKELGLG